jgi:hypothetical protein
MRQKPEGFYLGWTMRYSQHSRGSNGTKPSNPSAHDVTSSSKNQRASPLTTLLRPYSPLQVRTTSSLGFSAPSAHISSRSPPPRVYLTRFVPSSGFLPLLTVCSSPSLPALFHAGALMGFVPFRAFPSHRAGTPFNARFPHAVSSRRLDERDVRATKQPTEADHPTSPPIHVSTRKTLAQLQGFAPCESPLQATWGLAQAAARCSLEFSNLLQGIPPLAVGPDSHRRPPPLLASPTLRPLRRTNARSVS